VQRAHSLFFAISIPLLLVLAGCRSANSYLEKGNAAYARGQFADASLNYRKAIQKNADFGEAYYRAGLSEMKQNKAPRRCRISSRPSG
jgi:tetratricopeptide (TPR) repeat protein